MKFLTSVQTVCVILNFDLTWAHNLVPTEAYTHGDYDDFSKATFERYDNLGSTEQNSQKQKVFERA